MAILTDVLCARVRTLDEHALAEMYDQYSPALYRYALRLLGDDDLAEECVADTFSRLLIALNNGGGPREYLRAYLYRVAHNWVSDSFRRRHLSTLPLGTDLQAECDKEPQQALAAEIERQDVRQALAKLTSDQRQVIVLRFLEDWEYEDISRVLNKPVGAVKALQHRGIKSLRRFLSQAEERTQ